LVLLLAAQVAGGGPNAALQEALRQTAQTVQGEGRGLLAAAPRVGPEGPQLRRHGLRLMERAHHLIQTAEGLSVQTEQAARGVRQEGAALAGMAREMLRGVGPLPQVARRLLAASERLRRAAREAPAARPMEPFPGLATGVSEI
jgi:hypothetical protein